jgi:hypothetical protein
MKLEPLYRARFTTTDRWSVELSGADGVVTPDFRGVLQTDDGATILFTWHGFGITAPEGVNKLVGAMTHVSDDERYSWLNTVICTVAGVIEPRADGAGLRVVLDVAQLVWQRPTA